LYPPSWIYVVPSFCLLRKLVSTSELAELTAWEVAHLLYLSRWLQPTARGGGVAGYAPRYFVWFADWFDGTSQGASGVCPGREAFAHKMELRRVWHRLKIGEGKAENQNNMIVPGPPQPLLPCSPLFSPNSTFPPSYFHLHPVPPCSRCWASITQTHLCVVFSNIDPTQTLRLCALFTCKQGGNLFFCSPYGSLRSGHHNSTLNPCGGLFPALMGEVANILDMNQDAYYSEGLKLPLILLGPRSHDHPSSIR